MINTDGLSVIVQGAIHSEFTPLCLQSIRKYLPDAEIILSTWEGSNVDGLEYDILILNEDPGYKKHCRDNNTNRQLVSIQGGLKKVSRQ
jgi:hypothetical protein